MGQRGAGSARCTAGATADDEGRGDWRGGVTHGSTPGRIIPPAAAEGKGRLRQRGAKAGGTKWAARLGRTSARDRGAAESGERARGRAARHTSLEEKAVTSLPFRGGHWDLLEDRPCVGRWSVCS